MKTKYTFCLLVLALGCFEASVACDNDDPPPPPPSVTSVSISGTATSSSVCANAPFTATVNVANEVTGLTYRWGVAIGTVNGVADFVTTPSKSVTCVVLRPPGGTNIARVTVTMLRNGVIVTTNGDGARDLTVLPNTLPAQPSFVTLQVSSPSPSSNAPCQFTSGTFSVPAVAGAFRYEWTFEGFTQTTTSPQLFVSFNNTGSQTLSVRARGCAGVSAAQTYSYFVIPSTESPCNTGPQLLQSSEPLAVAPNPASTDFTLTTTEDYVSAEAQLTDSQTGNVAKRFTVTGTSMKVNVSGLPAGTYLLTLEGKKGKAKASKRVVVEK